MAAEPLFGGSVSQDSGGSAWVVQEDGYSQCREAAGAASHDRAFAVQVTAPDCGTATAHLGAVTGALSKAGM